MNRFLLPRRWRREKEGGCEIAKGILISAHHNSIWTSANEIFNFKMDFQSCSPSACHCHYVVLLLRMIMLIHLWGFREQLFFPSSSYQSDPAHTKANFSRSFYPFHLFDVKLSKLLIIFIFFFFLLMLLDCVLMFIPFMLLLILQILLTHSEDICLCIFDCVWIFFDDFDFITTRLSH